jgi:hypothetical protein
MKVKIMEIKTIEYKLDILRKEYRNADADKRKLLIKRARMLEIAKEIAIKTQKTFL